jgi:hypothetical protein
MRFRIWPNRKGAADLSEITDVPYSNVTSMLGIQLLRMLSEAVSLVTRPSGKWLAAGFMFSLISYFLSGQGPARSCLHCEMSSQRRATLRFLQGASCKIRFT